MYGNRFTERHVPLLHQQLQHNFNLHNVVEL
jgi:hypothetical protein